MKHLGDITKLNGYNMPIVDVVTGGSPCQDLSVAGKRAGLEGERSGLFMEQIRIVKELRQNDISSNNHRGIYVRPRYMVWENVPGAFTSNNGEDFRVVLEEVAKIADKRAVIPRPEGGKWSKSGIILGDGFSIAWRLHDAQFWGVPQRRKRIALVADFGADTAPKILFERKSLQRDSNESDQKREDATADTRASANQTGGAISFLERAGKDGGVKEYLFNTNEAPHSQHSTIKEFCPSSQYIQKCFVPGGHYRYKEEKICGNLTAGSSVRGDTTLVFGKSSFGEFNEKPGALRASGGDYGGVAKC